MFYGFSSGFLIVLMVFRWFLEEVHGFRWDLGTFYFLLMDCLCFCSCFFWGILGLLKGFVSKKQKSKSSSEISRIS